jgi:hypothetical protein
MAARLRRACGLLLAAAAFAAAAPGAHAQGSQPRGPQAPADAQPAEPFAFADFTWLTGNPRTKNFPLHTKVVTGEFRVDTSFTYSFNHPKDDTITGERGVSSGGCKSQLGVGGDFRRQRPRRVMTRFGVTAGDAPQRRQPGRASGTSATRTATSRRRTPATTGTPCTA